MVLQVQKDKEIKNKAAFSDKVRFLTSTQLRQAARFMSDY